MNRMALRSAAFAVLFLGSALIPIAAAGADNWTQIASFSGTGDKPADTPSFTTNGGKLRFLFTVQPNSSGPVPFLSKMYPKGSPVTANELRRTQCIDCKGRQTDDLGNVRAGSYYLHIVTSRPWTLVVEETK
ncbi:MAG TPA: hypothetical protein VGH34_23620 [Vicinamibacterales bacterium]